MENLAATLSAGDTTFVLISAALVMIMIPGVAFFYGGMVGQKNVLNTIMQVFSVLGIASVVWGLWGYSMAFGPDKNGIIGDLSWFGFQGVSMDPNSDYAATIPHMAFAAFQMMFAVITPALITGAIVERMRFPAFMLFIFLWSTFVYAPLAHWVWGIGGWIRELGALDFAGGLVVHISSGVAGLVACLMLGKRIEYSAQPRPHHQPMTVVGATLLWFGWFGFNAGSALAANGLAASAFVATHLAASAASISWLLAEWLHSGKPSLLGLVSGAVAGLVAITPAAGFVTSQSAVIIGLIAGVFCYFAVASIKVRLGYDDSLDAFGIHGIGGLVGAILTGIFATKEINSAGADGLLYGNAGLLTNQLISVAATVAFTAVMTYVVMKVVMAITPARVGAEDETVGLDIIEHGQVAYDLNSYDIAEVAGVKK